MVVQLQSWCLLFNRCGKNDDLQRYFHRQINRWDTATNLQRVEKRQEVLRVCKREKCSYLKNFFTLVYWGKEETVKRFVRISTTSTAEKSLTIHLPEQHLLSQDELKKWKSVNSLYYWLSRQGVCLTRQGNKIRLMHMEGQIYLYLIPIVLCKFQVYEY